MCPKKTALIILDGWGHGNNMKSDAIYNSHTPFIDSLYKSHPNSELKTYGDNVGLPEGQMGNSEVGHINIGAGRVIYQDLARINHACSTNSVFNMHGLNKSFSYAKNYKKPLHLIGLLSNGGVHSHQDHLHKLCSLANQFGIKDVFIHAFSDGRDCDPKSSIKFIKKLEKNLHGAKIASLCGRYYAMDRDNRWERVKKAYDLIVNGKGMKSRNLIESIRSSYKNDITDEFIRPIVVVDANGKPLIKIGEKDAVICFNFRTDRCRQLTHVLTQEDMPSLEMYALNLHYTTMTCYDKNFKNVNVIFKKENIKYTLGEVLEKNNKSQIRISETEKYPHVTYFFSGGREKKFRNEHRILINSPEVKTYDLQPEMSAKKITSKIILELKRNFFDFVCLNFANTDMVGHTGNYNAIIKAVETVDSCIKKIVETGLKKNYAFLIISDHGNADFAVNDDGTPNTAHTTNPVPCIAINTGYNIIENGKLADIAPTILKIMGLQIPNEMTGKILISRT